MLKRLKVTNFTVFLEAEIRWSKGLNVIVGENGSGKSQLMRLAYALSNVSNRFPHSPRQDKVSFQRAIAEKIVAVCKPEALGRLISRQQGRNRCEVEVDFVEPNRASFSFSFSTNSQEVKLDSSLPTGHLTAGPVFFPTREMLSVFPGFVSLYDEYRLEFDETYYDLAKALDSPAKKRHSADVNSLIAEIERLIGGHIVFENGKFYLVAPGKGKFEAPLMAEGVRKMATLAFLLINGSLSNKGTLFWDEPETNLNPKLIRSLADALFTLGRHGYQIVLATHSLFLLREIRILGEASRKRNEKSPTPCFIGLGRTQDAQTVEVVLSDTLDDIHPLVLLDEDIGQTERYLQEG
jgi:energy-coupling factor transporter ATP-binding protein EcfA2